MMQEVDTVKMVMFRQCLSALDNVNHICKATLGMSAIAKMRSLINGRNLEIAVKTMPPRDKTGRKTKCWEER